MDVIPLDASLVKGSHGRPSPGDDHAPLLITQQPDLLSTDRLRSVDVAGTIWRTCVEATSSSRRSIGGLLTQEGTLIDPEA